MLDAVVYVASGQHGSVAVLYSDGRLGADHPIPDARPPVALRMALEWLRGVHPDRRAPLSVVWDQTSPIPLAAQLLAKTLSFDVKFVASSASDNPASRKLQGTWQPGTFRLTRAAHGAHWQLPDQPQTTLRCGQWYAVSSLADILRYGRFGLARKATDDSPTPADLPDADLLSED